MKKKKLFTLASLCMCAAIAGTGAAVAFADEGDPDEPEVPATGITVDGSIADWAGEPFVVYDNEAAQSTNAEFKATVSFKSDGDDLYLFAALNNCGLFNAGNHERGFQLSVGDSWYTVLYFSQEVTCNPWNIEINAAAHSFWFINHGTNAATNDAEVIGGKYLDSANWQVEVKIADALAEQENPELKLHFLFDDGIKGEPAYTVGEDADTILGDGFLCPIHEYGEAEVVDATCEAAGSKTETCDICGFVHEETIDALAPEYNEEEPDEETPASCTTEGKKVFKCIHCDGEVEGHTKTVTVPKLEASYEGAVKDEELSVAPTCTTAGKDVFKCVLCDGENEEHVKEVVIKALGHTDEDGDGKCDRCGEEMPNFVLRDEEKGGFLYDWNNSTVEISTTTPEDYTAWAGTIFEEFEGVQFAFTYKEGFFYLYFNVTDTSMKANSHAMFQIRIKLGDETYFYNIDVNNGDFKLLKQTPNVDNQADIANSDGYYIITDNGWAGEVKLPLAVYNTNIEVGEKYTIEYALAYIRFDFASGGDTRAFGTGEQVGEKWDINTSTGIEYGFEADVAISNLEADKETAEYTYKGENADIVITLNGVLAEDEEEITVTVGGEAFAAENYTLVVNGDGTATLTIKASALTGKEGFTVVVTDTANKLGTNKVEIAIKANIPDNYGAAGLVAGQADFSKNTAKGDLKIQLDLQGEKIAKISVGNSTLKEGTDYTYDEATGTLTLLATSSTLTTGGAKTIVIETENDASRFTFSAKVNKETTTNPNPPDKDPGKDPGKDPVKEDNGGLGGGAIAGIVIGCLVGVAAIAAGVFFLIKFLKNKKAAEGADDESDEDKE